MIDDDQVWKMGSFQSSQKSGSEKRQWICGTHESFWRKHNFPESFFPSAHMYLLEFSNWDYLVLKYHYQTPALCSMLNVMDTSSPFLKQLRVQQRINMSTQQSTWRERNRVTPKEKTHILFGLARASLIKRCCGCTNSRVWKAWISPYWTDWMMITW